MAAYLFEVHLVYGGDRSKPVVVSKRNIVASSTEDAKIKSGVMKDIQDNWDSEYITILIEKKGEVSLREKTKKVILEKDDTND